MSSCVRTTVEAGVGSLVLDRPARFNALDVETARDYRQGGLRLARDPAVRCLVLWGAPGVFCSGADLKYIRDGGDEASLAYLKPDDPERAGHPGAVFQQILEYLHGTISELRRAPKPVIAAVDGIAAAGGFGLAMACDLVLASDRASFEWAYTRTALSGAESSTMLLPRLVGLRQAFGMILLNPRLTAEQARAAGLVNLVFPQASFADEVTQIARRLAEGPTAAYAAAKQLVNQATGLDRLDHHLDREIEALARSADSADFAEGLLAFFGKREPRFVGK
jgi:2-(1,2-epoxy-1,2-dihydrophenyl)acetyl-CoA isomerase